MDKRYALTFDIDWAPDFAILHCLELLGGMLVDSPGLGFVGVPGCGLEESGM